MPRLLGLLLLASFLLSVVIGQEICQCNQLISKERKPVKPAEINSSVPTNGELLDDEHFPDAPKDEAELRAKLGAATWRLLHTMAARYPETPNGETKRRMARFLKDLSHAYPCPKCAKHMRKLLKENPPKLKSQKEFSQWMCKFHNLVNQRLGKNQFPCKDVDFHYDCGCGIGDDSSSSSSSSSSNKDSVKEPSPVQPRGPRDPTEAKPIVYP